MDKIISKEIYETLKNLKEKENFLDIPEIKNAIIKFEDAITCIISSPEKLNPNLTYDLQLVVSSLMNVLKNEKKKLRKSQIASLISIMDYIISGKTKGFIKLPTGAGKTRLFSEIVTGINLPTVILVPKINLRGQTSNYFEGANIFNIGENGTVINNTKNIISIIKEKNIFNPIIIATYQSFTRLKDNKQLFEEFSKLIKVVIRDEAHRSLGDKTKESLDEMNSYNNVDESILKEQDKDLLETDILYSNEKLELLFTATPKLLNKSIRDTYEEIFSLSIQDLIEEGILHMPKFIQVSEALINIGYENIGEKVLNQFATKFVNEKGEFTYDEITNKYIELKEKNNGYLPAVGFCRDIEHAEFIRKYLEQKGIKAIRVTSENSKFDAGVSENEAKKMIEANEVDIVVTVTKVSEGWDIPTLRCVLNFAPIISEAKYIQGTGRVLRTFNFEEKEEVLYKKGVLNKSFAFIIEPKFWSISNYIGSYGKGENESLGSKKDKEDKKIITKISGITHLIDSGEFDMNYLRDLYGDLDEYSEIIIKEDVLNYFKTHKTYEEWLNLKDKDIKNIKFKGKSIIALVNITGWSNPNNKNLQTISGFQEFIAWAFDEKIETKEIITKEEVLNYFKTHKTYEEWLNFQRSDIKNLDYKGIKIYSLTNIVGWNNPNKVKLKNSSGFQEFIAWIFNEKIEKKEIITKEEVFNYFKTHKTYEEWLDLKDRDIKTVKFKGKSIIALVTISGWNNPNNVRLDNPSGLQEFISWALDKKIEPITKKDVLEYLKTYKTYEKWIILKTKDIKNMDFKGLKIKSIANIAGWNNPNNVEIKNPSGFQEFIAWVFDKKIEKKEIITKEDIFNYFKTDKTFEQWLNLKDKDIKKIKFKGKAIQYLANIVGWNNPNNSRLHNPYGFKEFITWVYGKENPNKKA